MCNIILTIKVQYIQYMGLIEALVEGIAGSLHSQPPPCTITILFLLGKVYSIFDYFRSIF
jgi:hypothetical protein